MDYRLKTDKTILVTGGTGIQGGAVASALAATGWRVRALVRTTDKPSARMLAWKGIELVKGDLNDRSSVNAALKGVYGVFCNLVWIEGGVETEIRQGRMLIDAAKAAGVRHFVYSSVGGAERHTGIPHFDSKWQIEEYLRASGLQATIVRPTYLMTNFNRPDMQESIRKGTLSTALRPDTTLQMLAPDDIGAFVNIAFENSDAFAGQAIELAGDELTMPRIAGIFGRHVGRSVLYVQQPIENVRSVSRESALMFEWFNKEGYRADINALRKIHPGLLTLEIWLANSTAWAKAA